MSAPQLLTTTDVAEKLVVTVDWVQHQCRTGTLPAIKLGREYRIHPDDLTHWVNSQRQTKNPLIKTKEYAT